VYRYSRRATSTTLRIKVPKANIAASNRHKSANDIVLLLRCDGGIAAAADMAGKAVRKQRSAVVAGARYNSATFPLLPRSPPRATRRATMSEDATIITDLFKSLKHSPFVMIGLDDTPDHSQPMTAQIDGDNRGTLWFFTSRDNRLAIGGAAMMQFVAKGHDLFACVHGTLTADNDPAMIDRLWSKQVEAWFPGGKQDPNLLLMRYDLENTEIGEADVSLTGMAKMLFGGTIKPSEAGSHAEVALHEA